MSIRNAIFLIAAVMFAAVLTRGASAQQTAVNRKTVWNGVYNAEQAMRGKTGFETHCISCHANDLDASNPDARFRGPVFMDRWREYDLESFFSLIKGTMPRGDPGSLSDGIYIDIVSHLLLSNAFPAGKEELTMDVLENVQIEGRDGPKPLPGGALVQLVGCLARGDRGWIITNASNPARTMRSAGSTEKELAAAQAKSAGNFEYQLQNLDYLRTRFDFNPDAHEGHKMQTKGYLIRQPSSERIDLTSMEMIASSCPP